MKNLSLSTKSKPFFLPGLVLLSITILSATIGKSMITKLFDLRSSIEEAKQKNNVLATKKTTLTSLNLTELSNNTELSLRALPPEEAALSALYSFRALAFEQGIQTVDFEVKPKGTEKGISNTSLSFRLQGNLPNTIAFIKRLQHILPVIRVSKARITNSGSQTSTETELLAVWAELPTTLPPVDTPSNDLTNIEREFLQQLKGFETSKAGYVIPANPEGRSNPFTQ